MPLLLQLTVSLSFGRCVYRVGKRRRRNSTKFRTHNTQLRRNRCAATRHLLISTHSHTDGRGCAIGQSERTLRDDKTFVSNFIAGIHLAFDIAQASALGHTQFIEFYIIETRVNDWQAMGTREREKRERETSVVALISN